MAPGLKWEELKEQNIKIQQEEGAQTFMREIVQLRRSVNVAQNSGGTNISQLSLARIQLKMSHSFVCSVRSLPCVFESGKC